MTAKRHLLGHQAEPRAAQVSLKLPAEHGQDSVPKVSQKQGGRRNGLRLRTERKTQVLICTRVYAFG